MICKNCGFDNMEGANFCIECGTRLEPETETEQVIVQENPENPDVLEGVITQEVEEDPAEPKTFNEIFQDFAAQSAAITAGLSEPEQKPDVLSGLDQALADLDDAASKTQQDRDPVYQEESQTDARMQTSSSRPAEMWYYMDGDAAVGPFSVDEIFDKIHVGAIDRHTYVWTKGLPDWIRLSQSPFDAGIPSGAGTAGMKAAPSFSSASRNPEPERPAPAVQNPQPSFASAAAAESTDAGDKNNTAAAGAVEWFCVQDSRSTGPFTPEVIGQMLKNGTINPTTYVWKEGMPDWEYLRNTELASMLNGQQGNPYWTRSSQPYENPYGQDAYNRKSPAEGGSGYRATVGYVRTRSIVLYILLSILTCGIWQFVWYWQIANDINEMASLQNKPKGCDPTIAIILSLITCNLYSIYYFYKEGTTIAQLDFPGYRLENQSILLAILGAFIPIASLAILQDQINSVVKYGG